MWNYKVYGFIAILAGVGWYWTTIQLSMQEPVIAFLDVGQGDATYIRTTNGADIFIDGGPDRTVLERAAEVMQPLDQTIETLILTHPDADHITGIVELVKRYKVKQIITTALPATKPLHLELMELIEQKQINHTTVAAGDTIQLDPEMICIVLYPSVETPLLQLETNNTSLIVHCNLGIQSLLLTGDIEQEVEETLVVPDIDILKVAHHGSKSSSTEQFLTASTPEVCIIEVGQDNSYGHPHAEVIERLQRYCQVRRTDQEGTIIMPLSP